MQIASVTSSQHFFASARPASSAAGMPSTDQAMMNISPDSFSNLVKEAAAEPDVRQDIVDSFKSRIASGEYPSQDVVTGLTHAIGAGVYQLATAGKDSSE